MRQSSCATSAAELPPKLYARGHCSAASALASRPAGDTWRNLHHTDCGIRRLASYPEQLAAFFEIPVADLDSKAVEDPYASVRIDVGIARHRLPPDLLVSGLVYDVDTGLIEVVVPATTEQRRV